MSAPPPATHDRSTSATLLWACFLGSSWTWVLGMIVPVLLIRDFGLLAWFAFVIPNAAGAAAMGFVIAQPERSRAIVQQHTQACLRFSEITLAFHVFVIGWVLYLLLGPWGPIATIAVALAVLVAGTGKASLLRAAAIITAASLTLLVTWIVTGHAQLPRATLDTAQATNLLLLAPALAVGLILCPYLDLTFHRTRQHTEPRAGKWAFALGFGVVFMLMMLFALLYATTLRPFFADPWQATFPTPVLWILGAHLVIQAGFTAAIHLREITVRARHQGSHRAFMFIIIGGALAFWASTEETLYYQHVAGEVIYRSFLLAYGIVFPAYVWLCMIPAPNRPKRVHQLATYFLTTVITLPLAYLGLIVGYMYLIPIALLILAAARLVIHKLPPAPDTAPASEHSA